VVASNLSGSSAGVPSRSLGGYGSFGAAPLPLYRTQPMVDIPAYFQLIYEIIHNSALIRTFVEWGMRAPFPSSPPPNNLPCGMSSHLLVATLCSIPA
jgi:hypothetical protein